MADTYTVNTQTPTTDLQPGGIATPAMEISFTTKPSGVVGRVRIPMAQYAPDEVDRVLRAQAALIESVQNL